MLPSSAHHISAVVPNAAMPMDQPRALQSGPGLPGHSGLPSQHAIDSGGNGPPTANHQQRT
eukprot:4077034-Alexandrium_andersonii.AAC.1